MATMSIAGVRPSVRSFHALSGCLRTVPLLLIAVVSITACSDIVDFETEEATALEIALRLSQMQAGDTLHAKAKPVDSRGRASLVSASATVAGWNETDIVWRSSDPSVVEVSESGLVLAKKRGDAEIVAMSGELEGSATVRVRGSRKGVVLSPTVDTLGVSQTLQLQATVLDPHGDPIPDAKVSWHSEDESVARVDEMGKLTAIAAGLALVVASSRGSADTAAITVLGVPTVAVTPGDAMVVAGGTVQLQASVSDAEGGTLQSSVVSWSSSHPSVATVSGDGKVTGVSAGSAVIRAHWQEYSGRANVTVSQLVDSGGGFGGSSTGSFPNEPAGFTVITDQPWNGLKTLGWEQSESSHLAIVEDAAAPHSPRSVMRVRYPAGWQAGSTPALTWRGFHGPERQRNLYIAYWVRLSENFVSHPAATKQFYPRLHSDSWNARNSLFTSFMWGDQRLITVNQQGLPWVEGGARNMHPNRGHSSLHQMPLAEWVLLELYFRLNTGDNADGVVRVWRDGALITEYTNVRFLAEHDPREWRGIDWAPIWGGSGGVVPATQYLFVDHIYISSGQQP